MREYQTFSEEEMMHVALHHVEKAFEQTDADSSNQGLNKCTNDILRYLLETDVDFDINLYGQIPKTLKESQQKFFDEVISEEH